MQLRTNIRSEEKRLSPPNTKFSFNGSASYVLFLRSLAHQSGAAEAWWAHNPQVRGSKPRSDNTRD
ncbi:hypothetical protein M758_6G090800 [Ceratodon purpureus]|nr:hypothetical protein M758_6G090800 [Ceratodon purpureus]